MSEIGGYRPVWLIAMFDLPVNTAKARKRYAQFRKLLLKAGFQMLQFSVYSRYYPSEEASRTHRRLIRHGLPEEGQIRLMTLTDRQFGRMDTFEGKKRRQTEPPPPEVYLF